MRTLRRFLAGGGKPEGDIFFRQTQGFEWSRHLVRFFYFFLLFLAADDLPAWQQFFVRTQIDPLWPVQWLKIWKYEAGVYVIQYVGMAGVMAAAFLPEKRWARLLAFVGLLEYAALVNSFGKIGHSLHACILIAFLFIFLPDVKEGVLKVGRAVRQKFLTVIWAAQATLLMTYSMAGLGKVTVGIYQLVIGEIHVLSPESMQLHIADRLLQTGSKSLIGGWMIEHPYLIYPLMLGTLYLQFFSVVVAFRPVLQRWWALGLIIFHVMSYFTLTIIFPQNVFLLCLLFYYSPFQRQPATFPEMMEALPLVGSAWRWGKRKKWKIA